MLRARRLCTRAACIALASCSPVEQPVQWRDPSPHNDLRITVAAGVQVQVLDWGGKGSPMIFLPGLGNTAHAFDEFAPRFRDGWRVYALTPRGFGVSTFPPSGYDSYTRAADLRAVLDSLGIDRAILVGHSIAGDLLSRFAVEYPSRVTALVYLDAWSFGTDEPRDLPPAPPQAQPIPMRSSDSSSVATVIAYWTRRYGVRPIEAEVRAVAEFHRSGRLKAFIRPNASEQVHAGSVRSEYARIEAPALGIFATNHTVEQLFPELRTYDASNRRLADAYFPAMRTFESEQLDRFRRELKQNVLIEFPGENHYLHYTRPADVERAMRTFLQ